MNTEDVFLPSDYFGESEIRVEVMWRQRMRPVVARVQTLPSSPFQSVLVGYFEDDPEDGDWIVWPDTSRRSTKETRSIPKLEKRIIEAFEGHRSTVVRAFEFEEWGEEPRIALLFPHTSKGMWIHDWHQEPTSFSTGFSVESNNADEAREELLFRWADESSDARFAWEWSRWSLEEKRRQLFGFDGDWNDLGHLMMCVLQNARGLWRHSEQWEWTIHPEFSGHGHLVNLLNRQYLSHSRHLAIWQERLFSFFVPEPKHKWIESHICAREFWQSSVSASVRLLEPPTAHEQLEARLELHEWLRGKASPEEIARLL